ncbi:MAG: cytochrome c [Pedosphaera sp.]|nr:cytochrome c [Pedosphaera sp.]
MLASEESSAAHPGSNSAAILFFLLSCAAVFRHRMRMTTRQLLLLLALCLALSRTATAAELSVASNTVPPVVVTNAATALAKSFQIKSGFRLELVASEPLVVDPIAMAFDENGRLFVIEMRDRPDRANGRTGRVRVLEDTDGDGIFDSSAVYADNLNQPSALICYGGGVFVGCGQEILFLKDSKEDGVADVRRVVFTGFSEATTGLNGPISFTSFAWGLDNRIHVGTAGRGGDVIASSTPKASVVLDAGNFCFDPRTFVVVPESGAALTGMSFDNRGRKFVGGSVDPVLLVMYEQRYAVRNPFLEMPVALLNAAPDEAAAMIFPARLNTARPPAAMTNGRPSNYFSTASGLSIYRGILFPASYLEDVFIADTASGVIHHAKLDTNELELTIRRPTDEPGIEFLAGKDAAFQPMQIINGPDGALYIADRTREEPGTPAKPTPVGTNAVVTTPLGHGRIFRIVPLNFKQLPVPHLGTANPQLLATMLMHANGWQRDTAARLLYERQDKATVVPVIQWFFDPRSTPLGRMHALHALDGLHTLLEAHVIKGLGDPDSRVREHAVLLAERFVAKNGMVSDSLWKQLAARAADPAIAVRYQLAFTLGQLRNPGRAQTLADLLQHDSTNRWMQSAALSSLSDGAGEVFGILANDAHFRRNDAGQNMLWQLLLVVGATNQPAEVARVMRDLAALNDAQAAFSLTQVLGEGLELNGSTLNQADSQGILQPLIARATRVMGDDTAAEAVRAEAILLLGYTSYADAGNSLLVLLNRPESQSIQMAAVAALGRFPDGRVAAGLVYRWVFLQPGARAEAVAALLSRPERTIVLLSAIEKGVIARGELWSTQIRFLLAHPDTNIRQRASNLLGQPDSSQRQEVVARFLPAAQMEGNVNRGHDLFLARCASCHQIAGEGNYNGVDLSAAARNGREEMLTRLLDPNRAVTPALANFLIQTKDGQTLTGFIAAQTKFDVTLYEATGATRVVPRSNIRSLTSLNSSAMPEGLESGLSQQALADLLEFLASPGSRK